MKLTLLLLAALFVGYGVTNFAQSGKKCLENRAAFDVGSGVTRVVVAKVDKCQAKIIKELLYEKIQVSYKDELEVSTDNSLSPKILKQGIDSLKVLAKKARSFRPVGYVGVATSVFRQASNGPSSIEMLAKESGIKIHVIDQDKEAQIGFYGALASTRLDQEDVVVWDIGGGSMQFVAKPKKNQEFLVYKGKLASNLFKNTIITKLQNKKLNGVISSPNPMSVSVVKLAREIAEKEASKVNTGLKKLLSSGNRKVIGIGGVHYYSIRGQTGDDIFDLGSVEEAIKKRSQMNDKEIGGKYAPTEVSNLVLVAGFMKQLGIKQVQAVKVNMAHGVLINELYWRGLHTQTVGADR